MTTFYRVPTTSDVIATLTLTILSNLILNDKFFLLFIAFFLFFNYKIKNARFALAFIFRLSFFLVLDRQRVVPFF